jgi:hypothetical protein
MQITRTPYTLMRGSRKSRHAWYATRENVLRFIASLFLLLCCTAAVSARVAAPVTISSGLLQTRTTIPVSINGQRVSCVLDTGTSSVLVSPYTAHAARLAGRAGTFELAPDGRTYMDRETTIARLTVADLAVRDVHALISSNLYGTQALCGYDFFTHFPTLIDRMHSSVTLFPSPHKTAHMHCLAVNLRPKVPLATIEINDTWLSDIVLDSGMAGGGALWNGVLERLQPPPFESDGYAGAPTMRGSFHCGSSVFVRFAANTASSDMGLCTADSHPDGYNGIIETNLPNVHQMFVDYAQHRICFDLPNAVDPWARYNQYRRP